jgi:hypothetical protein
MIKITAFNNSIYKFNIEHDNLQVLKSWIDCAVYELNRPEIFTQQFCIPDKGSIDDVSVWSTFQTPVKSFFDFEESDKLLNWIKEKLIQVAPDLGFTKVKSIDLTIDWMNIMYKNSFGNCHTHDDVAEQDTKEKIVAIFYLQAPENSAKFLVVKNNKDYSSMGVSPFTLSEDEILPIEVKTGDLIIHKVDLPHAVDVHMLDEPRLCLVMEFRYNQ